ncbi:unnamed protein product [Diplocarpon coronariae]
MLECPIRCYHFDGDIRCHSLYRRFRCFGFTASKVWQWVGREFQGRVKSSFANPAYINQNCQTAVSVEVDPDNASLTCLSVEHAGQGKAYHNSIAFLDT